MAESLSYQPSNSAVYYTSPKAICRRPFLLGLVGATVGIIVGAFAYGHVQPKLEKLPTRVGAMVVAAVATGLLAMMPVRIGRVRSPIAAGMIGALLSLISLYVMWVAWTGVILTKVSTVWLMWHPYALFRLIQFLNAAGVWVYSGIEPKGLALLIYWLGEGALIVACAVLFCIKSAGTGGLICRECGAKCRSVSGLPRFADDRRDELVAAIEARDFSAMLEHDAPRSDDDPELILRMSSCTKCRQMHVLSLNRVAWVVDSNNRATVKTTSLVNQLLITTDEAAILRDLAEQIKQTRTTEAGGEGDQTQSPVG